MRENERTLRISATTISTSCTSLTTKITMNDVPYVFIDFVAHALSSKSAPALSGLSDLQWSSIGATHQSERLDHTLAVIVSWDGLEAYVRRSPFHIGPFSVAIAASNFEAQKRKFDRIGKIYLFGSSESNRNKDDTAVIKRLLEFYQVPKLYVHISLDSLRSHAFLWRQEYNSIRIFNEFTCDAFLDYHLLENPKLEEVVVRGASYDRMWKLTESFKQGQKQDVWDREPTNKSFQDLEELSFQSVFYGISYKELECENAVANRKVTFGGVFKWSE
ncbi:hypothetical protein L596_009844 [Steinernema carpocapsae]|uniref:Uncharacterized protein n=1 Tax=Steinernema carpocapsae TaxID=34508 RepID=A0A4U5PHV0_STECR|nr:hypothetical protein L596_009844 [Steinernema carpocapsae]